MRCGSEEERDTLAATRREDNARRSALHQARNRRAIVMSDERRKQTPNVQRPTLNTQIRGAIQHRGSRIQHRFPYFGADEATSFWKRGSFRSGSNIGSSRSSAGVSGRPVASGPLSGIESSFSKAAMARS